MKFMVEVRIPTDIGNEQLKSGNLIKQLHKYLSDVRPEKVYFSAAHGKRTIYMIIDVTSAEKMPEITEPLWLDWNAEIHFQPLMDASDFEKAGPAIERILKSRM